MLANTLFLAAASAVAVMAQSREYPDCIQQCIVPISSFCDGDETGAAKDKCTCDTYANSDRIPCMRKCSEDDQATYAAIVPESCRAALFPGITVDESATTGDAAAATTTITAKTTTAAETGSETAATTAGGGNTPSQTSEAAADASATGDGSAAAGREISTLLAVAGLVAALMA